MLVKAKKHIIAAFLVSIIIYISLAIFSDLKEIENILRSFSIQIIPLLILFSVLTQLIRAIRWQYYLNTLSIKIGLYDSISIFMASLFMGFTPGKLGEGIKSYFLKKTYNIPNSKTLPIVVIERISDIIGLIILASVGTIYFSWGKYIVVISFLLTILLFLFLSNSKLKTRLINWLTKIQFLKKYTANLTTSSNSVDELLQLKPIIITTLLSCIAWFFEFLIFYLIINDITEGNNFISLSFAYAVSILAGSISMLPAGLGVTESSLSYFLIESGISSQIAITSTILVRIFTLWFTILLGFIFFFILQRKFGKINSDN